MKISKHESQQQNIMLKLKTYFKVVHWTKLCVKLSKKIN